MEALTLRPTREQFDALVLPHLSCLHRAARRVLGSDDLAWDAVQETLFRFWRNGRIPADPRAALLRVVRPTSLQILRSQRRRTHHEQWACTDPAPHPDCEDPVCVQEQAELTDELRRAIDGLPKACREAFRLRVDEGLGYEEIATALSIPVGTVRSRLARARDLLEHALARSGAAADFFVCDRTRAPRPASIGCPRPAAHVRWPTRPPERPIQDALPDPT
jgi:RNA polymerase sigma factor (sigma-70 family)